MRKKDFFTTREAARLLNISQSTVTRKFDQGFLSGVKNPITGKRLISRDSIVAMMNHFRHPDARSLFPGKRVLIASPDQSLLAIFDSLFSPKKEIQVQKTGSGAETLFRYGKEPPDLFILDEDIADLSAYEILRSVRRENRSGLKIVYFTKEPEKVEGLAGIEVFDKTKIDKETLGRIVSALLELPEDIGEEGKAFQHRRRWPRKEVDIAANISVYRMRSPYIHESGKARLRDISVQGARLCNLVMAKGELPGEAFRILVEVDQAPLSGLRAHCRLVRLQSDGGLTAGVEFVKIMKSHRDMIAQLFDSRGGDPDRDSGRPAESLPQTAIDQ